MSESEDGGPGRREVAHRIFAAEFDDAEFSYSESDEERAPNYVVTPTGARVNRLFAVGVLTELEQVNDDVLRARIVDPTGPFVVYAGQYQPEALAFLETATPPLFVAITGKARTFEPEDGDRVFTSIRPESISEVDAETRDRWVVQAAEQTIERVGLLASAKASGLSGDQLQAALADAGVDESSAAGVTLALEYYGTTGEYAQAVRELATHAAAVVAGDRDEAGSLSLSPDDGTDGPLSALATMTLEAPEAEATPSESSTDPDSQPAEETPDAEPTDVSDAEPAAGDPASGAPDASEPTAAESTESTGATGSSAGAAASESGETPASAEPAGATTGTESPEPSASAESSEATTPGASSTATGSGDDPDDADTLGDFDAAGGGATDDGDEEMDDFDTEFELDDDEREEIQEEYGTDFQSGTEVDEPGEADIETPDPEELAEMEAMDSDETVDAGSEAAAVEEAADDSAGGTAANEPAAADAAVAESPGPDEAEDVDLEDAVMAAMKARNDGTGADREAVVDDVVAEYGADRAAVEDAIQDALMGGRCYEPEDGKLTPI